MRHLGWREGQAPSQELKAVPVLVSVGRGLGMQNAGFIVAVNLDSQAPLHGLAAL